MKSKLIAIGVFAISLLMNTIPLVVWKDYIAFSVQSYIPLIVMILVSANGVLSYLFRHKGNFLSFGTPRGRVFGEDNEDTFSKAYRLEFYWQFVVYCSVIPFYIPCMFFGTRPIHSLWTLCVIFVPQIVFVVYGILKMIKGTKEYRLTQQKQEQERKEQQRREEIGYFK